VESSLTFLLVGSRVYTAPAESGVDFESRFYSKARASHDRPLRRTIIERARRRGGMGRRTGAAGVSCFRRPGNSSLQHHTSRASTEIGRSAVMAQALETGPDRRTRTAYGPVTDKRGRDSQRLADSAPRARRSGAITDPLDAVATDEGPLTHKGYLRSDRPGRSPALRALFDS